MRKLTSLACLAAVSTALAGGAGAAEPAVGSLSIERGRGAVTLEVKGAVVLGRLGSGWIAVTDRTPNDPYVANVTGRKVYVQKRVSPTKIFIRGMGLRFRMLGGNYRISMRGTGIALSAVGRGAVTLEGEPRFPGEDVGVYSFEGVDCSIEPEGCLPFPEEQIRVKLEPVEPEGSGRTPRAQP